MLHSRAPESAVLDRVLDAARAQAAAVVLLGEAGIGKTELLEHAAARASGFRVVRAVGVESELELAFAGLHQLCGQLGDHLERLAPLHRQALATAFGLSGDGLPDRFGVGVAVLSLLAKAAEEQPLLCIVDNAQWLDPASMQTLGFVARRLSSEPVALLFGLRTPSAELAGIPELVVEGLADPAALALMESVITGPLDERVRDRLLAEARGNPLALLELPETLTPAELTGGMGLPAALPLENALEESLLRRLQRLPDETRLLLLIAAAEPVGDPALLGRAAEQLGLGIEAAAPSEADGLFRLGAGVAFRHPLVRSVVYHTAPLADRLRVHRALAESTDPAVDPDRQTWHRAHAALGPDEDLAEELERCADRARERGRLAVAAAFLERGAILTSEPSRRAARALAAARAMHDAGYSEHALELLRPADPGALDERQQGLLELLRAQLALELRPEDDAAPLLVRAAKRLETLDERLARETYLEAMYAAIFESPLDSGPGLGAIATAARAAPASLEPRPVDLLLNGLAAQVTEGYGPGAPIVREALVDFHADDIRWHLLAFHAADNLWEDEAAQALAVRIAGLARRRGTRVWLPQAVSWVAYRSLCEGEFGVAARLIEEAQSVAASIGGKAPAAPRMLLAAWRGHEDEAAALNYEGPRSEGQSGGGAIHLIVTDYARAVLNNGLGRYDAALAAAQRAVAPGDLFSPWVLSELIEAAVRSGDVELAGAAVEYLRRRTRASGTELARGIRSVARALVSQGDAADILYQAGIEQLGHTRIATYRARTHLLYGEWLRREGRRLEAREHLQISEGLLAAMGAHAFAERAARELLATGQRARQRTVETLDQLTVREAEVARLARDGHTNNEIGSRLFISGRTVEYHLHKVYRKLGIASRRQLHRVLPGAAQSPRPRTLVAPSVALPLD
ncbi:MAG: LuxR family transcriptional regulator [Actinomycetia bacterium]|nr:LuxR family transcriptional regulator [Actinomycetes bacterium]